MVYNIIPAKFKNYFILLASIVFYAWGASDFIIILVLSTIIDFYIVKALYESPKKKRKQLLLFCSIFMNVGLLAYFKYANFFIDNVNQFLGALNVSAIGWTNVLLPIGISFYTFQTLTYSIDVYRGVHKPLEKLSNYLLYIMSFPQMIAGPIVRFNLIADEIIDRKETIDDKLQGFIRFCIGLGKKVLIANVVGEQADLIMNQPVENITFISSWIGILAYTFQIYFDFAGYSDMAIGLGKMMGFSFPENFNNPYTSKSITEFWRRWHMTLGQWMRDYLYIPLGGNRVDSKTRLYFNLWFVFLVSGLWHGASWNFVIWGAFHGFFLILDKIFLLQVLNKIGGFFSTIITFIIVVVGWVFFRLEKFDDAINYIKKMFSFSTEITFENISNEFISIAILAFIFSFVTASKIGKKLETLIYYHQQPSLFWYGKMIFVSLVLLVLSISAITAEGFNPFIYFRF
ncbi:MAG TPA: MBOAT family O-acyltransferase [Vicingaceae bacterium]|nr:MBOAT family O-acyltransferase [Vicingaceae bacterium]